MCQGHQALSPPQKQWPVPSAQILELFGPVSYSAGNLLSTSPVKQCGVLVLPPQKELLSL